tara:strand:- start:2243 stop:3166 length:924 start_codon:yes stop_codon:yes gene_type:complete
MKQKLQQIFSKNNLGKIHSIKKIGIGFNNEIYSINDKFILKICKKKSNESKFKKEVFAYNFFKDKIPVPKIIYSDTSKKILKNYFMIYYKIKGEDSLYAKWHSFNDNEKKEIIKQISKILKIINQTDTLAFDEFFSKKNNWKNERISNLISYLKKVKAEKIISSEFIKKIELFVEENKNILQEEKLGLVYGDIHFDNFIIKNKKIVGIIDFEDINIMSLDYALDSIRRMKNYPEIYASEKYEKLVKKQDYIKLMQWFQEFYPELFNFKNLDRRLDLYSIEYDLRLLPDWPKTISLKRRLAKYVGFNL